MLSQFKVNCTLSGFFYNDLVILDFWYKNFGQGFRYAPLGQEFFFNMFQSRLIKCLVVFITFLLCQFLLSVIQNKNVKGRGCYYNICNRAKPGQPQACWESHIGQRCLLGPANRPKSYSHGSLGNFDKLPSLIHSKLLREVGHNLQNA